MFAAHQLEGTSCLATAPKVQTLQNSRVSKSRRQSRFFTLYGSQLKLSSTEIPYPIPVHSNAAQRDYSGAENLNSAKHNQIKYANKYRRSATYLEEGDELILSTKNLPADKFNIRKKKKDLHPVHGSVSDVIL